MSGSKENNIDLKETKILSRNMSHKFKMNGKDATNEFSRMTKGEYSATKEGDGKKPGTLQKNADKQKWYDDMGIVIVSAEENGGKQFITPPEIKQHVKEVVDAFLEWKKSEKKPTKTKPQPKPTKTKPQPKPSEQDQDQDLQYENLRFIDDDDDSDTKDEKDSKGNSKDKSKDLVDALIKQRDEAFSQRRHWEIEFNLLKQKQDEEIALLKEQNKMMMKKQEQLLEQITKLVEQKSATQVEKQVEAPKSEVKSESKLSERQKKRYKAKQKRRKEKQKQRQEEKKTKEVVDQAKPESKPETKPETKPTEEDSEPEVDIDNLDENVAVRVEESASSLGGAAKKIDFINENETPLLQFLQDDRLKSEIIKVLSSEIEKSPARLWITSKLLMQRDVVQQGKTVTEQEDHFHHGPKSKKIFRADQVKDFVLTSLERLGELIGDLELRGSGWQFIRVISIVVNVSPFNPFDNAGSKYIPISKDMKIPGEKYLINIKNEDEFCFKYSVICSLLHQRGIYFENPNRVSNYAKKIGGKYVIKPEYEALCNWEGVTFPADESSIETFEENNPNILVFVHYKEKQKSLRQWYISSKDKTKDSIIVRLLLIRQYSDEATIPTEKVDLRTVTTPVEYNQHFITITSMSAFSSGLTKHRGEKKVCDYCLQTFTLETSIEKHEKFCKAQGLYVPIHMPKPGTFSEFIGQRDHLRKFPKPFSIVSDFESRIQSSDGNHIPDYYSLYIDNFTGAKIPEVDGPPIQYTNGNPEELIRHYFEDLEQLKYKIYDTLKAYSTKGPKCSRIDMTAEDKINFRNATECYICGLVFADEINADPKDQIKYLKVRDHDHFKQVENYRGAACWSCNINQNFGKWYAQDQEKAMKYAYEIPVLIHNAKNYDLHLILKHINKDYLCDTYADENGNEYSVPCKISVIATNAQKFMNLKVKKFTFIDTYQHLSTSLASLAEKLPEDALVNTRNHSNDVEFQLAKTKGIFPYEWYDSHEKLKCTSLPPIDAFVSKISGSGCTQEEYDKCEKCWQGMGFESFLELKESIKKIDKENLDKYYKEFNKILRCKTQVDFYTTLFRCGDAMLDYNVAQNVWKTLGFQTFDDYLQFYLKTDVLLLADVFRKYRKSMLKTHGLDPIYYLTSPGFSWAAFLKCLKENPDPEQPKKLELISDYDMLMFFEKQTRGGYCCTSKRYSKANHKYLPEDEVDATKPFNYIEYFDMNALYSSIMALHNLPCGDFQWCHDKFTVEQLMSNPEVLVADKKIGYTLEVDLHLPKDKDLRKKLKDYPLAPTNRVVDYEELSDFQRKCTSADQFSQENYEKLSDSDKEKFDKRKEKYEKLSEKDKEKFDKMLFSKVPKLVADFKSKLEYVVHGENLKYYIEKGYTIDKIHRVVQYKQSDYMKCYIELNNALRTEASKAKNDFEKDLFKLLNNSVYGRTMMNKRNQVSCKVITDEAQLRKYNADPFFEKPIPVSENCVIVQSAQDDMCFDSPIYIGSSILDLSKLEMYTFYYDVLQKKYGPDKVHLCYSDTDSLILEIETEDFYKDMKGSDIFHHFDTSEYPKDNIYGIERHNEKVLLKMKDEMAGKIIKEFVGLRAKMYSIKYDETIAEIVSSKHKVKHRAKGLSNIYTARNIIHQDYLDCVNGMKIKDAEFYKISSVNHQLKSEKVTKKSLDRNDSKRYICEDGVNTLPYGYYDD